MAMTTIADTPRGAIYEYSKIPSNMFQFFILEKRTYKNGDKQYAIGLYLTTNPEQSIIFKEIRGTKKDAIFQLERFIEQHWEAMPPDAENEDDKEVTQNEVVVSI